MVAAFPRGVIVLLGAAGATVTVAGLQAVADILAPVFLALMLTVTVSPLSGWFRRHGAPTWVAMLATVITVYCILAVLGGAMIVSVARLIELMPTYQSQFAALRADLVQSLAGLGINESQLREAVSAVNPSSIARILEFVFGGLTSVLSDAVFLLAVLLFMCVDAVGFPTRLSSAASDRPQVVGALRTFAHGTRRYLLVSTIFGLIVAVIDTFLLWALGIPLPVLWGLLAFITNYIPNVGFLIGLVPPALLALLVGGTDLMVTVIVLYSVINFIIQSLIQPKMVGDAVGLSTTVSFLSLVFWAWVLGPLGALLAIPMSLLVKGLLVDIDPSTTWIGVLLSGGPLPDRKTDAPAEASPAHLPGRRPVTATAGASLPPDRTGRIRLGRRARSTADDPRPTGQHPREHGS
jgi:predicted PurR-regulated permease PerM